MKTGKVFSILAVAAAALGTWSCSTDFELNAPYNEIPVVFGLLDQSADTQFVKINKSFIGDGNNAEYAAVNDSSMYSSVAATVEEHVNGSITNTFNLQEMWVSDLDEGIFYTDSQKVYYFVPPAGLNNEATYKLKIDVAEEAEEITSETTLIQDLNFSTQFTYTLISGVNFANASSSVNNNYPTVTAKWLSAENGKRYEVSLRFYYNEHTASGVTNKYFDWSLGSQKTPNTDAGSSMFEEIAGDAFYQMVANRLEDYPYEADVIKRVPDRIEFYLTVAGEDLNTYMEVNEPALGVVTERPSFTNIDGGVGIFSSRYKLTLRSIGAGKISLNKFSTQELCEGQYTSAYKFCTDSIAWNLDGFYCP